MIRARTLLRAITSTIEASGLGKEFVVHEHPVEASCLDTLKSVLTIWDPDLNSGQDLQMMLMNFGISMQMLRADNMECYRYLQQQLAGTEHAQLIWVWNWGFDKLKWDVLAGAPVH